MDAAAGTTVSSLSGAMRGGLDHGVPAAASGIRLTAPGLCGTQKDAVDFEVTVLSSKSDLEITSSPSHYELDVFFQHLSLISRELGVSAHPDASSVQLEITVCPHTHQDGAISSPAQA